MSELKTSKPNVVAAKQRAFDHILIIMFENEYRQYVLQNPYMRRLARQGIELRNFHGVMHPSQTNYIASIAGELCNITSDDVPKSLLTERTIVDLIEEAPGRLQWKAYMDGYARLANPWKPNYQPGNLLPYLMKHNPFSSFLSIVQNEKRWKRIDSEAALFADLLNGELPEYAWFTPNIWNDGHWIAGDNDGKKSEKLQRAPILVDQLACWLEEFFERLRFPGPNSHLPPRTLVVVTFDESDFETDYQHQEKFAYDWDGPNQIYTVLLGDGIQPGFEEEGYNHYSLLRTIEVNFDLGHLGKNDADANWFQFLWGRHFEWSGPQDTPFTEDVSGPVCAAGFAGALFVACAAMDGTVRVRTRAVDNGRWSAETTLQLDGSGGLAAASTFTELVLLARSASGRLQCMTYDLRHGWSVQQPPTQSRVTAFALSSFSHETEIMAAFADSSCHVSSSVYRNNKSAKPWTASVKVPAAGTVDSMALGVLGESLYLTVKKSDSHEMRVISYNTATFNVVSLLAEPASIERPETAYNIAPRGPQDNTTVDAWSPSSFPVASFSWWPDPSIGQRQPSTRPYETSGPMSVATLDGVMHLVHPGAGNSLLMTETFSIAGILTPLKKVSYKQEKAALDSDGFGTLKEAGWSRQTPIFDACCEPGGTLAMGRAGSQILLLCRARAGSALQLYEGRYVQKNGQV